MGAKVWSILNVRGGCPTSADFPVLSLSPPCVLSPCLALPEINPARCCIRRRKPLAFSATSLRCCLLGSRCVQNQVDEVIDVMQENITKVIERGERLDDLQDKSESLSDNATAFSNRAKQLRRQMWWRGCKMKAVIALVAVILLLVIIIPIVLKYRS
ncbi:vesicle-associated membrane protein 4 isoform X2 [Apteryx rowi]|uniref:vesicle-associated membrane protein 4 isoform X2 n=1 Tax=Apteryx rowi TaxID=308060 RepID=UPI000E1DF0D0|nr:vesicle-associated membrane protein 4 isoform X2 [Apteryx rowi]